MRAVLAIVIRRCYATRPVYHPQSPCARLIGGWSEELFKLFKASTKMFAISESCFSPLNKTARSKPVRGIIFSFRYTPVFQKAGVAM